MRWTVAAALGVLTLLAVGIRASAQSNERERYEYRCLTKLDERIWTDDVIKKLNEMGSQGWA